MGAYLSQPLTDKESLCGSKNGISWGASAMQGWRIRMEDAHVLAEDIGVSAAGPQLYGVFDGHGGREVALFCRDHMPREVKARYRSFAGEQSALSQEEAEADNVGKAIYSAFHAMDDMLRDPRHHAEISNLKGQRGRQSSTDINAAQRAATLQTVLQADIARVRESGVVSGADASRLARGMTLLQQLSSGANEPASETDLQGIADRVGCTAVCVAITSTYIVCANAGDSRAVLCRSGRPVALSCDHKPNNTREQRRIEAAGGFVKQIPTNAPPGTRVQYRVNGELSLSRAIGDLKYKRRSDLKPEQQAICATPDLSVEERMPEDEFIVIACDGIWDVKTNKQVIDFVRSRLRKGTNITNILEELMDSCLTKDPKATNGLGADNMTAIVVLLQDPLRFPNVSAGACMLWGCWR
mmetsp:Transcript_35039/g.69241  ORF Transcript_35039/g.69241 Transcript_35039/m.69241 type:complete len:412 (+) Transcript_35039:48-1283(+)